MPAPLTEVYARFTTEVDDRNLKKADKQVEKTEKSFGKLGESMKTVAAILGAGVLGAALKNFGLQLIGTIDEIDKVSARVGLSTDALQEFRFAADISGVGAEKLSMALGLVQQKAFDAASGSKEAKKIFDELGLSVTDANGELLALDELLLSAADGFARAENQTAKTALAMKIFGESGKDLIPFLEQGRDGVEALRAEFRELGGGFSADVVEEGARAQDSLTRLKAGVDGLKGSLAVQFLPVAERVIKWIQSGIKWFQDLTKNVDLAQLGIITLAVTAIPLLTKAITALFSPIGKVAVLVGAAILLVDDLVTAYKGGQSVVRDFFLEHFNFDIRELLDSLVEGWFNLKATVMSVPDELSRVWNSFKAGVGSALTAILTFARSAMQAVKPLVDVIAKIPGLGGLGKSFSKALSSVDDTRSSALAATGRARGTANAAQGRISGRFMRARGQAAQAQLDASVSRAAQDPSSLSASQLMSAPASSSAAMSSTSVNQSVSINVSGAQDPEAVGKAVRRELARERRSAMSAVEGL